MQNIRLTTATDVLAAIPALLGFVPTDSVVMVALTEDSTLAFVARTDAQQAASVEQLRIAIPQSNVSISTGSRRNRTATRSGQSW